MTKSTITDERVTSVIERLEHYACNLKWTNVRGSQELLTAADGLRELQERRKADSEPLVPVVDADDNFYSWFGREWHENYQHNQYTTAAKQMLGVMAESAWKAGRCSAMLQAEPVTTANKLPFEQWLSQQTGTIDVECGCVMTEVFFHWLRVAYEAGNSPEQGESRCGTKGSPALDSSPKNAGSRCGNSPAIPDGYVMVPKEPTAEMQSAGASAIRIETTALNKLWTGNAVFRAMLAAAPQEVNSWSSHYLPVTRGDAVGCPFNREVKGE